MIRTVINATLVGIIALVFSSCAGNNPHMDKRTIEYNLEEGISESFEYDKITNIKYKATTANDKEIELLKSKFESQVPYEVYICSAELENLDLTAKASYRLLCAYNDNSWQIISCTENNKDTWEYKAKSTPDKRRMYKDISAINFSDFEPGYIGNEMHSDINIKSESYDENVNRQTYDIVLTVNTDFGHYDIDGKLIYYFINGEWVFGDFEHKDIADWKFTYNDACELNGLSENKITDYLILKDNFLTYTTNKDYVSDYSIKKLYISADQTTVTEIYSFNAVYENLCEVTYKVKVKYEWLIYEWSEPTVTVEVSDSNFSFISGKTFTNGNNSITVTDCHKITDEELKAYKSDDYEITKACSIISCEIQKGEDSYNVVGIAIIPLRDNNWTTVTISDTRSVMDVETEMSFDTNKKSIFLNGKEYLQ